MSLKLRSFSNLLRVPKNCFAKAQSQGHSDLADHNETKNMNAYEKFKYHMRQAGRGLRLAGSDIGYYFGEFSRSGKHDLHDRIKFRKVGGELVKFVPYSLFVLIPLAEVLIPPYLFLFPNSTPGYFQSESSKKKVASYRRNKQQEAWPALNEILMKEGKFDVSELKQLITDASAGKEGSIEKLKDFDRRFMQHLLENQNFYEKQLGADRLQTAELKKVLDFFDVRYMSGVFILNRILNIHIHLINLIFWIIRSKSRLTPTDYSFNFRPMSTLTRALLRRQFDGEMRFLKHTDNLVRKDFERQMLNTDASDLETIARNRAFFTAPNEQTVEYYRNYWLPMGELKSHSILWAQVMRRNYVQYLFPHSA